MFGVLSMHIKTFTHFIRWLFCIYVVCYICNKLPVYRLSLLSFSVFLKNALSSLKLWTLITGTWSVSSTTPTIVLISMALIVWLWGEANRSQSACTFAPGTTSQESALLTALQKQVLLLLYLYFYIFLNHGHSKNSILYVYCFYFSFGYLHMFLFSALHQNIQKSKWTKLSQYGKCV